MTDSFEDLHKQLVAAQQQLYVKRQLKQYDANEQETIISQIKLLEKNITKQINDQLNKKVIVINIHGFHEQAKKMVLQRIIETFGYDMAIVDLSPFSWPSCRTGYQYKRLKIGDIPGDMIGIEYLRDMFRTHYGVFDGKVLFEHLR